MAIAAIPVDAGRYSTEAYGIAFGTAVAIHVAVWLWLATLREEPMPHRG